MICDTHKCKITQQHIVQCETFQDCFKTNENTEEENKIMLMKIIPIL